MIILTAHITWAVHNRYVLYTLFLPYSPYFIWNIFKNDTWLDQGWYLETRTVWYNLIQKAFYHKRIIFRVHIIHEDIHLTENISKQMSN